MDKPKAKVVKSKSSVTDINTKPSREKNKKSRSNAEFQPRVMKKRGVYVEKAMKLAQAVNLPKKQRIKAPPRPRPGKKRFLASVLNILSKSTTGTQLPEIEVIDKSGQSIDKLKLRAKRLKYINDNKTDTIEIIDDGTDRVDSYKKTKLKYKSKILNETKKEPEQFMVLQTKKEIIQTPSIFSERSSRDEPFKFSDLPRLVKNDEDLIISTDHVKNMNNSIAKEVMEGKMKKMKKVTLVDNEPLTLVAEQSKKDDKNLYNFFVDLLETTFSLHNVRAAQSLADVNLNTQTTLKIDESVAKKLDVTNKKTPETINDLIQKPSRRFYSIKNEEGTLSDHQLLDYFKSKPTSSKWSKQELPLKPAVKSQKRGIVRVYDDSYCYSKKPKEPVKTQNSVVNKNKSFYKNINKKNLLNLFKEQLRMDDEIFEEPQNLYQALKQIARNKRKCRKSIKFDYSVKKTSNGYDDPQCIFKRRKVISPSTKWSKKYKPESELLRSMRPIPKKYSESEFSRRKYTKSEYTIDHEAESYHSLEVLGYDYENTPTRRSVQTKNKPIIYTYDYSTTTISNQDFSPYDTILKYTASSSSSDKKYYD